MKLTLFAKDGDIIGGLMPCMPNSEACVHARFWIETAYPLEQAAETMAGEQSTRTFVRMPGETDELRQLGSFPFMAAVEDGSVAIEFVGHRGGQSV